MWIVYFLASGVAYLVGAAMTSVTALVPVPARSRAGRILTAVLVLLGAGLALLSSTPSPTWVYVLWFGALALWLARSSFRRSPGRRLDRALRISVVLVSLVAAWIEWPYQRAPKVPHGSFPKLYVVGDSISAGIQANHERAWPQVFADGHGVRVVNLAVAGATCRSALAQAMAVADRAAVVLVEIGGNDLLTGTPAAEFESNLGTLIAALRGPERLIVMTELPLPPFCNAYGAAQRRVARAQGVVLIPKRYFARVLSSHAATVDGLHLSADGHRMMADAMWSFLHDLFDRPPMDAK